jgi:hypothetical protein
MKTRWLLAATAIAIFALTGGATLTQDRGQRDDQNRNGQHSEVKGRGGDIPLNRRGAEQGTYVSAFYILSFMSH